MEDETENFVRRCDKCQRYANNMHQHAELLHSIIASWPFMKWGMDIVGPLPQAPGKKRLEAAKGRWPEALQGVLWAYKMTSKISTEETPFSLVYDTEALIPVEIGEPSLRFEHKNELSKYEKLRTNLNLAEERRESALIRMAAQMQRI
ncbi:uncharacterized protein [Nicotiana tomentosiformis]|uniref:uncharacterized protein n=1 Tax=Nicotiana tomentosiformis TaxID=4098 RepID=UPI00051CA55B|nr:uncharacterized protein LOC104115359 [Nicotiana tomentosiformis]